MERLMSVKPTTPLGKDSLIDKFLQDCTAIPFQALTIPDWEFTTTYLPHVCTNWDIYAYESGIIDNLYTAQLELQYGLLKMPWGTHRITAILPLIDNTLQHMLYRCHSMDDALQRIEPLWRTVKKLPIELVIANQHIEIAVDNKSLFMDLWRMHDANTTKEGR